MNRRQEGTNILSYGINCPCTFSVDKSNLLGSFHCNHGLIPHRIRFQITALHVILTGVTTIGNQCFGSIPIHVCFAATSRNRSAISWICQEHCVLRAHFQMFIAFIIQIDFESLSKAEAFHMFLLVTASSRATQPPTFAHNINHCNTSSSK